jgi:hypothetical protein
LWSGPASFGIGCFFAAKFGEPARFWCGVGDDRKALINATAEFYRCGKVNLNEAVAAWADNRLAGVVYECVGSHRTGSSFA